MKQLLRVLLVDDHQVLREGIREILLNKEILNVEVYEASDGLKAIEIFRKQKKIDIILMDVRMAEMDGITTCRELCKSDPDARVIFLSMQDDAYTIKKAIEAGAKGYILKSSGIDEIILAIHKVMGGEKYYSSGTTMNLVGDYFNFVVKDAGSRPVVRSGKLTQREQDVLHLISMEKTSEEIAIELDLSKRTVEKHRYKLMSKLGAKSTVGLIKTAIYRGWITPGNEYA